MVKTGQAALHMAILASMKVATTARLPTQLAKMDVKHILETVEEKLLDTSEERQAELRAATLKIKMTRNRSVTDYANKHRILRKDMIIAGCTAI